MRIIVDGFGGDHAPLEVLKGCALARQAYDADIVITGQREKIRQIAQQYNVSLEGIEILDAEQNLTMEDSPKDILKAKKNSSMGVAIAALAEGKGDALVSAGNTGALVLGSLYTLRCIEGIRRPALAPIMPADNGRYMLLDAGANLECRPLMLQQYGIMGSIYMQKILKVSSPRVGLANIGTEETKGGDLQKQAFALLKESGCHFIGNVEARDIPFGVCDVVVADAFTGNIILKLTEGVGLAFTKNIKDIFKRNFLTKTAALLVMPGLREFRRKMDYSEYGGAPLMGISKPVIKAHGSSHAVAFKNAVRQAINFVSENVIEEIRASLPADSESDS